MRQGRKRSHLFFIPKVDSPRIGQHLLHHRVEPRGLLFIDLDTHSAGRTVGRLREGEDVVTTLKRMCRQHDYPQSIRADQGTEFVSRGLDLWAYQRGVTLDFSRRGKPTDNSYIESFNGKLRAECLNAH